MTSKFAKTKRLGRFTVLERGCVVDFTKDNGSGGETFFMEYQETSYETANGGLALRIKALNSINFFWTEENICTTGRMSVQSGTDAWVTVNIEFDIKSNSVEMFAKELGNVEIR